MKARFSLLVIFVFVANTILVSAWAKPCMFANAAVSMSEVTETDEMPCHGNHNKESENRDNRVLHCDGVCLCFHVLSNQLAFFGENEKTLPNTTHAQHITFALQLYASTLIAPPSPPPKLHA